MNNISHTHHRLLSSVYHKLVNILNPICFKEMKNGRRYLQKLALNGKSLEYIDYNTAVETELTLSLTENLCRSTPSVRAWLSGSDWLKGEENITGWGLGQPGWVCESSSGTVLGSNYIPIKIQFRIIWTHYK